MTDLSYKAARQRLQALLDLDEYRSQMRAIDRAEARFDQASDARAVKNERNRRYYHRQKLKNQLLQSLEQTA